MLKHQCHARTAVDPDVVDLPPTTVRVPELDACVIKREGKNARNVIRQIGEAVREVLIRTGSVKEVAPVGSDSTPDEGPWRRGDDGPLPELRRYRPKVLLAGSVLRK